MKTVKFKDFKENVKVGDLVILNSYSDPKLFMCKKNVWRVFGIDRHLPRLFKYLNAVKKGITAFLFDFRHKFPQRHVLDSYANDRFLPNFRRIDGRGSPEAYCQPHRKH